MLLSLPVLSADLPSSEAVLLGAAVVDLSSDLAGLSFWPGSLLRSAAAGPVVLSLAARDPDASALLLCDESRLALDDDVLLRGGELGAGVFDDEDESDAGIAASTNAAKLLVRCAGSGRVDRAAIVWTAVLAGMSDVTLTTLEPLAIYPVEAVQQGAGQR